MPPESPVSITISALRIRQPIGDIYIGSIPSATLVEITYFDIRQLVEERGIDSYIGVQRELDRKRVEQIAAYVRGPSATFPTAVVLAIPEKCVTIEAPCEADANFVRMTLSNYPANADEPQDEVLYRHIARVIDGQHRIKGLDGYDKDDFEVNVSIFVDADIADQAAIFSTVNLAQTKVNRSLVYDLLELSESRSPEKTCHSVVVTLDSDADSPLFRKIKRLGKATPGRFTETLSQATVVTGILQYICRNELQIIRDRQIGRRGGTFPPAEGKDVERLVLRPFFIESRDVDLTNVIWNYFDAVKQRWPDAWATNGTRMMLNRTNGFNGLMKFFARAYRHYAAPGEVVTTAQFLNLFAHVKLRDEDFNPQRFVPGSTGASELSKVLVEHTGVR